MFTIVFFFVVFLACNSNATSLQSSSTRHDPLDLQVITLDSGGNSEKRAYYSYDQLLTLSTVTVNTERDPNTNTRATYTGVYISDLFGAFGADPSLDVIGARCSDGEKQYYDRDYVARHRPILLLKFNNKSPDDWPHTESGSALGPYCVVHESFNPGETIYGYVEQPKIPYGVVSLELTGFSQSVGRFIPKKSQNDPEVAKGQKIVIGGGCTSCHKLGNAGGQKPGSALWKVLIQRAVTSKDYFRKYVTNPKSINPTSQMTPHPTFDDNTFNALEAYFKAMLAEEVGLGQQPAE
jgi:cytochrome c2